MGKSRGIWGRDLFQKTFSISFSAFTIPASKKILFLDNNVIWISILLKIRAYQIPMLAFEEGAFFRNIFSFSFCLHYPCQQKKYFFWITMIFEYIFCLKNKTYQIPILAFEEGTFFRKKDFHFPFSSPTVQYSRWGGQREKGRVVTEQIGRSDK